MKSVLTSWIGVNFCEIWIWFLANQTVIIIMISILDIKLNTCIGMNSFISNQEKWFWFRFPIVNQTPSKIACTVLIYECFLSSINIKRTFLVLMFSIIFSLVPYISINDIIIWTILLWFHITIIPHTLHTNVFGPFFKLLLNKSN